MIVTCPSCGTQYSVKDGAIPAQGRKVRCASCGESWHQDPEAPAAELAVPDDGEPLGASQGNEAAEPEIGAAEPDEPIAGFSTVQPVAPGAPHVEPPMAVPVPLTGDGQWDIVERSRAEDEFDPDKEIPSAEDIWAVEEESESDGRRNWLLAIMICLALVAALAAAFWFLAPDSLRRNVGLAGAATSPLQITAQGDRQTLASGNELLAVSGRVINPSSEVQPVPPIQAQIRDAGGRVLHSWTISPPARTLAPGASASFNSAEMDVPAGGDQLTVTLGRPARG
jgi:predicted Zn finger-like uncharacterized protein